MSPHPCFGADEEDQQLALVIIRRSFTDRRLWRSLVVDSDPTLGFTPPDNYISTWFAECYALYLQRLLMRESDYVQWDRSSELD